MSGLSEFETLIAGSDRTIEVVEETAEISKTSVTTGTVSVRVMTEEADETVSAELSGKKVVVDRIPVGTIVDEVPETRVENGVTIVPVFEEVLVVERRIRLIEELHIRHEATSETVRLPVTVRKQKAFVERQPTTPSPSTTKPTEE